jgi:hypothetical protein
LILIIKSESLSPKWEKDTLTLAVQAILRSLDFSIDISCVAHLFFTHSFAEDIQQFQLEEGLPVTKITNNDDYAAGGKTVRLLSGKSAIFIRSYLLPPLLEYPHNQFSALALHILHHELAHAHDYYVNRTIYASILPAWSHPDYFVASTMWGEYIAERLSAITNTDIESATNDFICSFPGIKREVENAKHRCITGGRDSFITLFNEIHARFIGFFILQFCRLAGYYHATDARIDDFLTTLACAPGFDFSLLQNIENALRTLYDKYPDWESKDILVELAEAYYAGWKLFGIEYLPKNGLPYGTLL